MSDYNVRHNRAVWFDIPFVDLDRAAAFYADVLKIQVSKESMGDVSFAVLEHGDGNGGCLVPRETEAVSEGGVLIYLNVNGRIKDAVQKVEARGGRVVQPVHGIGPHGFRALVLDSEGNRIALHSESDV